jgi:hypothetical protein
VIVGEGNKTTPTILCRIVAGRKGAALRLQKQGGAATLNKRICQAVVQLRLAMLSS